MSSKFAVGAPVSEPAPIFEGAWQRVPGGKAWSTLVMFQGPRPRLNRATGGTLKQDGARGRSPTIANLLVKDMNARASHASRLVVN